MCVTPSVVEGSKRTYDARMSKQADYWSNKAVRRIQKNEFADVAAQFVSAGASLLDLGCGRGDDSVHFAQRGCTVTAIDISSANIDYAKEAAGKAGVTLKALQHDLTQTLPFNNASFDAVYAHLSLHYFDDATTKVLFADIYRVLKPGGLFFVKCKSVDDPLYGKGERVDKDMYVDGHVRHFFSEEYMRECLKDFHIERIEKTASTYVDYESAFIEAIARKKS